MLASNPEHYISTVVILGSQYFGDELRGWNGGEQIW